MSITIRKCTEYDARALSELGKSTFYETWISVSTEDNMHLYLQEAYSEEVISKCLRSSNNTYYVAEVAGMMIGFAKLRYSTENPEEIKKYKCLEVAQIYVDKNYHDKKVGAALMSQAIIHATGNNFEMIWLGTWGQNERAMRFYSKFGFEKFGKHKFIMGSSIYEDVLMKKRVK